jgi:hypothetical protein
MTDWTKAGKKAWETRREKYGSSGLRNSERGSSPARQAWETRKKLYGASGISKNKMSKEEILFKLSEMRSDLNRVIKSLK